MIRVISQLPGSFPSDANIVLFSFENSKKPLAGFMFGSSIESAFRTATSDGFTGKSDESVVVHAKNNPAKRFIFVGLGPEDKANLDTVRHAASLAARKAAPLRVSKLYMRPPQVSGSISVGQAATEGVLLGSYKDTRFKSSNKTKPHATTFVILAKDPNERKQLQLGIRRGEIYSSSTIFVRDLVNNPPSSMDPETLAQSAVKIGKGRVKVKVLNKAQMEKLGMGAILGVNRGSAKPPYFLHLTYKPAGKKPDKKIGICGKGITFDSGGLSLKPARAMETMKMDMAGAATVIGIFKALGALKPPVEVHGFAPLTENMPGGRATKPGDILKTMRGKTIEVLNTDAEGRLVLADTLSYACEQKLDEIIDLATLTGACIVALGTSITAIMGTKPELIKRIRAAAQFSGEKMWELPLEEEYETHLKSKLADIKNVGKPGEAGTIIGGLFLKEFVDSHIPWAHLDIAGSAWSDTETPISTEGGTGAMVRTLLNYITSAQ